MDNDGEIEVDDFIPDVGAEETVVSPGIIQQDIVDKLEAVQNHKFEDFAYIFWLANIFTVSYDGHSCWPSERPRWKMMQNPMSLCRNTP